MSIVNTRSRHSVFSVVVSAGQNTDLVFLDLIDQSVLLVDTAGPAAGKPVL